MKREVVLGALAVAVLLPGCHKKKGKTDPGAGDPVTAVIKKAQASGSQSCGTDYGDELSHFGVAAFPKLTGAYEKATTDAARACLLDLADEVVVNNQKDAGVLNLGATLACHALSKESKNTEATSKALMLADAVVMAGERTDRPGSIGAPWKTFEACTESLKNISDNTSSYVSSQVDLANDLLGEMDCKCRKK